MISIIIPAYNEEMSVRVLCNELTTVMRSLGSRFEVIFVDDGSTDRTFEVLKELVKENKHVKVVRLARRFGQSAAISAGFNSSSGEILVTLDADLQNDPNDIPKLLNELKKGFDVVCGWRKDRKDPLLSKKLPSLVSNSITRLLTGLQIHDFGCTLRAYTRGVANEIELYGEKHRYVPALAFMNGFSVAEIEVRHCPRKYGKTKYNVFRTLRGLTDLLVLLLERSDARPTYLFGGIGIMSSILTFVLLVLVLIEAVGGFRHIAWESAVLLFLLFSVLTTNCIIGAALSEMLLRVRYTLSGRQLYKIREIVTE